MAAAVVAWLRGLSNTGRALGRENGQPGEGDTRFLTGCGGHAPSVPPPWDNGRLGRMLWPLLP